MKKDSQLIEDLYWDGEDGFQYLPRIKGIDLDRSTTQESKNPRHPRKIEAPIFEQLDHLREYDFTYEASRHESWWLLDSLGPFHDEQWFDDVLMIVKGGKEASVYLCGGNPTSGAELLAAKVFRPRSLRNLRKDHIYREGRTRLDSDGLEIVKDRQVRAMQKRTRYGQELMHTSWIEHEYLTLQRLHEAGCDVPRPYASGHNAILMDFIGDSQGAAPTLNGVSLELQQARNLFDRVVHNLVLMLSQERVHGDLSAYNILYWEGAITLIDFPQAINPIRNPNAYTIFQRDVVRICEYFSSQGVDTDPHKLAGDLWTEHGYSTIPNILWQEETEEDNLDDDVDDDD
jgi:RIO kinase 1